jgi:hypothetical protein
MPLILPVIPATLIMALEAELPFIVGSTISLAVQLMRVLFPSQSCPLHLFEMPFRQ